MHIFFFLAAYPAISPIQHSYKSSGCPTYAPDNFYLRPLLSKFRAICSTNSRLLPACGYVSKGRLFLRMRLQEINKGGACSKWAQPCARVSACTGITCTRRVPGAYRTCRASTKRARRQSTMSKTRSLFENLTSDVPDPLHSVDDTSRFRINSYVVSSYIPQMFIKK